MDGDTRRSEGGAIRRELRAILRSVATRGVSNGVCGFSIAQKDQMEKATGNTNCNPEEENGCGLMSCPP